MDISRDWTACQRDGNLFVQSFHFLGVILVDLLNLLVDLPVYLPGEFVKQLVRGLVKHLDLFWNRRNITFHGIHRAYFASAQATRGDDGW